MVVDGMSEDGTRDILDRLASEDARLQVIDNPGRITSCALNAGIRQSRGRYIAIMGAHTEYAPDYLCRCVEILEARPEVVCSGGPIISRGRGLFGKALAAAMSHPLGVGNAKHRFPCYEGYAEGACFPMFRREVFDRIGLYDETLVRNQDDEFNYRIGLARGKIFISPRARCVYHVRETPLRLFRQYFQYGYWRVAVLRKHHCPASLRQLVPIAFFVLVTGMLLVGVLWPSWRYGSAVLPLLYATTLTLSGAHLAMTQGIQVGVLFPVAAGMTHLAYAAGFAWGMLARRNPRPCNLSPAER